MIHKLTPEELQEIKELTVVRNNLIDKLGILEYKQQDLLLQKEQLSKEFKEHKEQDIRIGKNLQQKYGDGNINLETGELTVV